VSEQTEYQAAVRAWAVEHHVPQAAVDRWLALGEPDATAILAVAQDLRLRTGQLLSVLELLAEICVRESAGAAGVLSRNELRPIIRGGGSRPERASALVDKLRELRYPRLTRTRTKMEAALAAMRLPPGVTVVLPKDLSSDELVFRLTVRTATELDKLLAALAQRKEEIKALIETLGGSDEM
jgi:hypothetical protein